jgi:competence protein ComEC
MLGFIAGAALLQTQPALPNYPLAAIVTAMLAWASAAALLRWKRQSGNGRLFAAMRVLAASTAGLALGFFWAALLAHAALAPSLAKADEGRNVTLVGTIDNLPYRFDGGVRFNFAVERVVGGAMQVPPRVALSWYAGFRGETVAVGDVQPGERWEFTVRLQRPHGNANPYACAS